jgi:pimeloyl-ACP methyl ester carboxylesterase
MIFKFRNGSISYNVRGKGKPVVLLHGYLETSAIWESFAVGLAATNRVITIDLPGHGGSDCFGETHSMDFMASAVMELADHLGIERFIAAGHSMGGYVALALADLFPGSLTGYCLFHSQPFPDTPAAKEKRMREIELVDEGKKEVFIPEDINLMYATFNLEKFNYAVERSREIATGIGGAAIRAVLKGMMERPSRLEVIEKGNVPCLWILGAADNYIPYITIREKVRLPANATVAVLENSGHMGFIEEEELSIKILAGFAAGLE